MNNSHLSDEQRAVLFKRATEAPFSGEYLYVNDDGTYGCANCHSPLFDSSSKFEAHCGWPSFDEALPGSITYREDTSHGMTRTEVICSKCSCHLGHIFDDGPPETTGQRYCINSSSLHLTPRTSR